MEKLDRDVTKFTTDAPSILLHRIIDKLDELVEGYNEIIESFDIIKEMMKKIKIVERTK